MRVIAALLMLLIALPAAAQNAPSGNAQKGNAPACPEVGASGTGNNVNQATGTGTQPCPDSTPTPNGRTTSKGGTSGQKRH